MTPRLRELEATAVLAKDVPFSPYNTLPLSTDGAVRGYKMALEDLAPVLAAARKAFTVIDQSLSIPPAEQRTDEMIAARKEVREALRDALEEVQDA